MEHIELILLLALVVILISTEVLLKPSGAKKKRSSGAPPAGDGTSPLAAPVAKRTPAPQETLSADILALAKSRFNEGSFREVLGELEKTPKPDWGEAECSLALRASLRLNNFGYARSLFEWSERRTGLRESALLQYLFAIICERAGDAKRAAALYDKLLRINGGYQDCEARLRRLRRLPAGDARTMKAYFATTGRGGTGRGPGRRPGEPMPALNEVAGRFSILGILGVGGSGIVFLAKDKVRGRVVALKRMRSEIASSPEGRALFLEEAKTLSELRHPRIVEFYEAVEFEENVYLVLEHVDWETLQTVVALRGRLTPGEVTRILTAVAEALVFAHKKNVIHRDLKPGNIVAGPKDFVKVMDFGIARHFDPDTVDVQEVDVAGTPPYMAPEQHAGVTTPLSDIYSFGVTAYVLVMGRLPFAGPASLYYSQKMERDYPRLPDEVPPRLREVIDRCLMFDPGQRPPDAASLLQMLSADR